MTPPHDPSQTVGSGGTAGRTRSVALRWLTLTVLVLLAACAGEFTTQSEPLRLLAERLPDAVLNEPYSAPIEAVGGLRPYEFALRDGTLPPGVTLQGGSVSGTPTSEGSYEFSIAVSDANLSSTFEAYTLSVVTPPPPSLSLQPPDTEVRGPVVVRVRVDDARGLLGLRTTISWDPSLFALQEDSVAATRQGVALLHESRAGALQVDLAMLDGPMTGGAQVFTFSLTPLAPPALVGVATVTEFASRRSGELLFDHQTSVEGPGTITPAPVQPETPAGAAGDASGDTPADAPEDAPADDPADAPADEQLGPSDGEPEEAP